MDAVAHLGERQPSALDGRELLIGLVISADRLNGLMSEQVLHGLAKVFAEFRQLDNQAVVKVNEGKQGLE